MEGKVSIRSVGPLMSAQNENAVIEVAHQELLRPEHFTRLLQHGGEAIIGGQRYAVSVICGVRVERAAPSDAGGAGNCLERVAQHLRRLWLDLRDFFSRLIDVHTPSQRLQHALVSFQQNEKYVAGVLAHYDALLAGVQKLPIPQYYGDILRDQCDGLSKRLLEERTAFERTRADRAMGSGAQALHGYEQRRSLFDVAKEFIRQAGMLCAGGNGAALGFAFKSIEAGGGMHGKLHRALTKRSDAQLSWLGRHFGDFCFSRCRSPDAGQFEDAVRDIQRFDKFMWTRTNGWTSADGDRSPRELCEEAGKLLHSEAAQPGRHWWRRLDETYTELCGLLVAPAPTREIEACIVRLDEAQRDLRATDALLDRCATVLDSLCEGERTRRPGSPSFYAPETQRSVNTVRAYVRQCQNATPDARRREEVEKALLAAAVGVTASNEKFRWLPRSANYGEDQRTVEMYEQSLAEQASREKLKLLKRTVHEAKEGMVAVIEKLYDRGQRLEELGGKTAAMTTQSEEYLKLARKVRREI